MRSTSPPSSSGYAGWLASLDLSVADVLHRGGAPSSASHDDSLLLQYGLLLLVMDYVHPRKLYTKKCSTSEPNAKSAKALCREREASERRARVIHGDPPFWRHVLELCVVLGVDLHPQRRRQNELSYGAPKPDPSCRSHVGAL